MTGRVTDPGMGELVSMAIDAARRRRRVPGATYRVQFHAGFTLRDATELVPYFHSLGVTHLYASPILKACPGALMDTTYSIMEC